ncbi:hypothetical protein [Sporosarcina sp. E16_8]|uniref:hypothetical protein n=1 Tax=Sporosarcina sp. E16_8 TaxID=2789295 RepID=UPI001A9257CC|nr:hypothetical protein [Sporosarcina sp. E16_8]MBO0589749.1 hypothetical protein [Sporosarcina sp. E16_8]
MSPQSRQLKAGVDRYQRQNICQQLIGPMLLVVFNNNWYTYSFIMIENDIYLLERLSPP